MTKKLYAVKTMDFRHELMKALIHRRMDPTVTFGHTEFDVPHLPRSIGSLFKDKPEKDVAVAAHKSRFMKK